MSWNLKLTLKQKDYTLFAVMENDVSLDEQWGLGQEVVIIGVY